MIPIRNNVNSTHYPLMTAFLIAANGAAFAYELTLPGEALENLITHFGVVPLGWQGFLSRPVGGLPGSWLSPVSSMFLHGSWFHLIGNMWFLWIFGNNVEDRMGHLRFLLFYLICGLIAVFAHITFSPGSPFPTIGASGAVAGILGAYFVSFPFSRVLTLIPLFLLWPVVDLPALLVLGFWFLTQFFNGTLALSASAGAAGEIAWWAHVGGFIAGLVLVGAFARRKSE